MEQKVTKTPEWSNDLAHFHVEELEERLENKWEAEVECKPTVNLTHDGNEWKTSVGVSVGVKLCIN
ncbi:MAG: hypothetical protein ACK4UP_10555 [Spirosomataceae bacterium]